MYFLQQIGMRFIDPQCVDMLYNIGINPCSENIPKYYSYFSSLVHRIEFRSVACWCGWLLGHSWIIPMVHLENRYSNHSKIHLKYAVL